MSVPAPHFLLFAEAAPALASTNAVRSSQSSANTGAATQWRFELRLPSGETSLEVQDEEPKSSVERLELLAIVRGLEALEQPSRVTLMGTSRNLRRGLAFGLAHWRENDWQWERYGCLTPVKNSDLWRRLDHLLEIHAVNCGPAQLETASDLVAPPPARQPLTTATSRAGRKLRFDPPVGQSATPAKKTPPNRRAANHPGKDSWLAALVRPAGQLFRALGLPNLG